MKDIGEYRIGDNASLSKTISRDDVYQMAELTGDFNPIHIDEAYSKNSPYKKCIAHGLFCEGIISALLGTKFPGEGTIILSQSLRFVRPVFISDTITGTVSVSQIDNEKRRMKLDLKCTNQVGNTVMEGDACIYIMEQNKL